MIQQGIYTKCIWRLFREEQICHVDAAIWFSERTSPPATRTRDMKVFRIANVESSGLDHIERRQCFLDTEVSDHDISFCPIFWRNY